MESTTKNTTPCNSGTAACNLTVSHSPAVDDNLQFQNDDWPKFLIIKSLDEKPILKHSIFIISKAIQGIIGEPKCVSPLKTAGLLLVEVDKKHHAINLLKTKKLHDIPVEITAHRTLNTVKGVIYCDYLEDEEDDEILVNLKETNQKVKEVYRLTPMRNGVRTKSNLFIITFSGDILPEKMYVGPFRVDVRQYIPNPRKCFQCQKFGHTKHFCKGDEVCDKCGQPGHQRGVCDKPPFCVNCKGDHPSSSRDCPIWKKEKSIVELKHKQNISFREARLKVEAAMPQNIQSRSTYATVVSKPTSKSDMSSQTEYTWPEFLPTPILITQCETSKTKSTSTETEPNGIETEESKIETMEFINDKNKRSRSHSLSSEEDEERQKSQRIEVSSSRPHESVHQSGLPSSTRASPQSGDSSALRGGASSALRGGDSSTSRGGDSSTSRGGDASTSRGGDSSRGGESSQRGKDIAPLADVRPEGDGVLPNPDGRGRPTAPPGGGRKKEDKIKDKELSVKPGVKSTPRHGSTPKGKLLQAIQRITPPARKSK